MSETVIGAQLYTLRDFLKTPEDIAQTMKKVAKIGYRAVQLSGLGKIDPKELRKIADGEGLEIAATHIGFNEMRDETQRVIDEHNTLGCKHSAIGGMPGEYRNAEGYLRFAREATAVAQKLNAGGLTFSYHNHSFELQKFGDRTGLQILIEDSGSEVLFEIDTYWIQHGGGDSTQWIDKVKKRIVLLHLKDMAVL
ncbi:MAG TPA: sugar phosphate isomerase/epimerase, partial [bacterium]|nr:sugar phosphate isomerase/epimerase [bacterium]